MLDWTIRTLWPFSLVKPNYKEFRFKEATQHIFVRLIFVSQIFLTRKLLKIKKETFLNVFQVYDTKFFDIQYVIFIFISAELSRKFFWRKGDKKYFFYIFVTILWRKLNWPPPEFGNFSTRSCQRGIRPSPLRCEPRSQCSPWDSRQRCSGGRWPRPGRPTRCKVPRRWWKKTSSKNCTFTKDWLSSIFLETNTHALAWIFLSKCFH